MTTEEFSNSMDTMLASYSSQAVFGEQASKAEIVLDEYEKSVLLTQAQDIIVKSYFDARLNAEGMGLDDGTKRQLDFSSLIRVANLSPLATQENTYDSRGIMYQMPIGADENSPQALFILNERLVNTIGYYENSDEMDIEVTDGSHRYKVGHTKITNKSPYPLQPVIILQESSDYDKPTIELQPRNSGVYHNQTYDEDMLKIVFVCKGKNLESLFNSGELRIYSGKIHSELYDIEFTRYFDPLYETYSDSDLQHPYTLTDQLLLPIDSKEAHKSKEYVIVPISYKEYDRMMSRPYSQPLKKQAWRLFQNQVTGFDVQTELIPKFNVKTGDTVIDIGSNPIDHITTESSEFLYKIRYVQRPTPIVLEDLPEGLTINGESKETECSLNPVLHQDILNKAVELALATRGGTPAATQAASQQQRRQE